jgi:hypothetical protein
MNGAVRSVVREGIVAGIIGAAVVAIWFLAFDIARGKPLLTPSLLGAAVFYGVNTPTGLEISLGTILGYTILHGVAFIAFGLVAAAVIQFAEREASLVIAVFILFAAFEMFFLGVVGALGRSVFGALVWWSILVGNLLAAVAMLGYFLKQHPTLPRRFVGSWWGILREGIVAGILGAAAVAIWFLIIDAVQGQPLRTPRLIGGALLARVAGDVPVVLVYTLAHGLMFILFGIIAATMIAGAERAPLFIFPVIILFTAFEVFFFAGIVVGASWILDQLAAWWILIGNLLAAAVMLTYFFRSHATLWHRLAEAWDEE